MKPINKYAVLVLVASVLAVLACGSEAAPTQQVRTATPEIVATTISQDEPTAEPAATDQPEPTEEPTEAPTAAPAQEAYLGDVLEQEGYSFSVLQVEDPATPGMLYQAEAGKRLVAFEVVVGNVSGDTLTVNPLDMTLLDAEGFAYQAELAGRDDQVFLANLNPGERVRGWVAFSIEEAAEPAKLKYEVSSFSDLELQVNLAELPAGQEAMVGTERETPEWPKLGDEVEASGYSLSAQTVEDPTDAGPLYQATSGTKLIGVEIVVGNVSGEQITLNPLNAVLVDSNGFVYQAELAGRDGQLELVDLNTGEKGKGWVAFEIPDDAVPESIKYEVSGFPPIVLQTGLAE